MAVPAAFFLDKWWGREYNDDTYNILSQCLAAPAKQETGAAGGKGAPMTLRTVCKELVRTPVKTALFLLLLTLSTALLVLGMNLYASCQNAREQVSQNYKTVGTISQKPDSTRDIDEETAERLMSSLSWYDPYAQYTVALPEDLFEGLPAKYPVELRPALFTTGENLPTWSKTGEPILVDTPDRVRPMKVVTFRLYEDLDMEDPDFLSEFDTMREFSSTDFIVGAEILSVNGEELSKPEDAALFWPFDEINQERFPIKAGDVYVCVGFYYVDTYNGERVLAPSKLCKGRNVTKGGTEYEYGEHIAYKYDEAFKGSQAAKDMEGLQETSIRLTELSSRCFTTVPTQSLDLLDPFYQDRVTIKYGRKITQEEFDSGARVCMVSEDFLEPYGDPDAPDFMNILGAGDKLTLHWYGAQYGSSPAELSPGLETLYASQASGGYELCGEAEYEIVGIYYTDMQGMDYETGAFTNLGAYEVIVPSASYDFDSIPILEGGPIKEGSCSFQLENGKGSEFMAALEKLPYADLLQVHLNDQGYTSIAKGLDAISLLAVILLLAGGASALCLLIFFVYLQIARRQREAAIQISLGAGRGRSAMFLLLSVLLVAVIGIGAGTALGHVVTDRVSTQVYTQAKDSGFSREYSDQFESSRDKAFDYDGSARWDRSLWAGLGALGAAAVLSGAFTVNALRKEPLEQLTRKD